MISKNVALKVRKKLQRLAGVEIFQNFEQGQQQIWEMDYEVHTACKQQFQKIPSIKLRFV